MPCWSRLFACKTQVERTRAIADDAVSIGMECSFVMVKTTRAWRWFALLAWMGGSSAIAGDWLYPVQPGDTIWGLSHEFLKQPGKWLELERYNAVSNDRSMPVGHTLRIPEAWLVMDTRQAVVAEVAGEVRVVDGASGEARALRAGERLGERDLVETAKNGGLSVRLPDGSLVRVGPDSRVRVDRLRDYGRRHVRDIRLKLERGGIENHVEKKHRPADRFEIETPAAVTAVRGTEYRLTAEAHRSEAEVLGGRVGVANRFGAVAVAAGFGTVARADRPPSKPRPLLPPPELLLTAEQHDRALQVNWRAVAGAVGYQVEVARDSGFLERVAEARPKRPPAAFPGLPDGDYHVRVRALDALGLRGREAVGRVRLDAHPWPPELLSPKEGDRFPPVGPGQVRLTWRASDPGTRAFRLQLGRPGLHAPLFDTVLKSPEFTPPKALTPGEYVWRVAAIGADGDQGEFSPARHFRVRPLPAPPAVRVDAEPIPPTRIGSVRRFVAHLPEPTPGVAYVLRLSEDPGARRLRWQRSGRGGDVAFIVRDPGVAWLRVKRVENGLAGPFGAPVRIENPSDLGRLPSALWAWLRARF